MSGDLNITFAADMPAASVEVLSPDLEVVARIMLSGGRSRTVRVPSEASFLRVSLPSGQSVILKDPGKLSRVVSMQSIFEQTSASSLRSGLTAKPAGLIPTQVSLEDLEQEEYARELPNLEAVNQYHLRRSGVRPVTPGQQPRVQQGLRLSSFATARIRSRELQEIPGVSTGRGREAHWEVEGDPRRPPLLLEIERPQGWVLQVRLPGDVQRCWVRADVLSRESALTFSVRLTTGEPMADTIMNYLQRGDLYSAGSMADWVEEAEAMLMDKRQDAYAAAVGAYLLLRLRQFPRLHDWAKNLANWFSFLPDGCVIWAWQMIHQKGPASEIRKYLLQAAARGLPVYTEGLRLLMDGLRLLGPEARVTYEGLVKDAREITWDSPLTASVLTKGDYSPSRESRPVVCNIAFASPSGSQPW